MSSHLRRRLVASGLGVFAALAAASCGDEPAREPGTFGFTHFVPPGTCVDHADCPAGEVCYDRSCVTESIPYIPDCPTAPLAEELECRFWDEAACACYAGLVAFVEREVEGQLSCGGAVALLGDRLALKQYGCAFEALDGTVTGSAVGQGEVRLRVARFRNETPCSVTPDTWDGRPARKLTCSQTCELWMVEHPTPPPERLVPDGTILLGTPEAETAVTGHADESPELEAKVTCFYMDRFEVTRRAYRHCQEAGGCEAPSLPAELSAEAYFAETDLDRPVTYVTHAQAETFCRFWEKELPTEAEWERAASAAKNATATYPWGDGPPWFPDGRPDCGRAVSKGCGERPRPATVLGTAARETGRSFFDVVDLAGNVREWVRDRYHPRAYEELLRTQRRGTEVVNPVQTSPHEGFPRMRVVRGGSYLTESATTHGVPADELRTSARDREDESAALPDLGFRCVRYKAGVSR